jgi:hypothetical protein
MGATEKTARFSGDAGCNDMPRDAVERAIGAALDRVGARIFEGSTS